MEIIDGLKSVAKTLREADKIEQYQQILSAQEKLLEMQNRIFELESENRKLKEEFEIKENLISDGNLYWYMKDGVKAGPFCTRCADAEYKLIRLHTSEFSSKVSCPNCDKVAKLGRAQVIVPKNTRNEWR